MSDNPEWRKKELALLRFMHALIGETISEVEANTDRMTVMVLIRNEPAWHGRAISFDAVLRASDKGSYRVPIPISMKVEQIPSFLLGSSQELSGLVPEMGPQEGGGA